MIKLRIEPMLDGFHPRTTVLMMPNKAALNPPPVALPLTMAALSEPAHCLAIEVAKKAPTTAIARPIAVTASDTEHCKDHPVIELGAEVGVPRSPAGGRTPGPAPQPIGPHVPILVPVGSTKFTGLPVAYVYTFGPSTIPAGSLPVNRPVSGSYVRARLLYFSVSESFSRPS